MQKQPNQISKIYRGMAYFVVSLSLVTLWLTQVSRPGSKVEGCFDECSSDQQIHDRDIRIVSLNMLHGFPRFENLPLRLELIAAEIERLQANLVLLQEVPWTTQTGNSAAVLAHLSGMNYAYLRSNGNKHAILFEEGSALLSRFPIIQTNFLELSPQAGLFEHRTVLQARLGLPEGELDVYVTHITNGEREVNAAQIEALYEFVSTHSSSRAAIIGGDFNATPDNPQILSLSQNWKDVFSGKNNRQAFTCCIADLHNGPEESLEKRIDYLFIKPGGLNSLRLFNMQRVFDFPYPFGNNWQWVSDHVGLFITLEMQP